MQINTRRTGTERFKPTKRESLVLAQAGEVSALIALNTDDDEPLNVAALKASEGLQALVELLVLRQEAAV